jgi:hypothetical protein
LDPNIKKEAWTAEEDAIIVDAHNRIGNRWADIAKMLVCQSCFCHFFSSIACEFHHLICSARPHRQCHQESMELDARSAAGRGRGCQQHVCDFGHFIRWSCASFRAWRI